MTSKEVERPSIRLGCLRSCLDDPVTAGDKQNKLFVYIQEKTLFW